MADTPRDPLAELAEAIADGTAIDWQAVADAAASREEREVIAALQAIAQIGEAHRSWPDAPAGGGPAAPPERWGHLEVLSLVGQGSYGEVYRARDVQLDREVALKLLRPGTGPSASDDGALAEGRLLARVRHPNVATVYGADRRDGRVGLWMEFIEGRTLAELLREQGTFGAREAALAGIELCRAVAAVHAQGIVHRDIKAQNVMRETGGRLVLTDFGIGKDLEREGTAGPSLSGTPLYLAPEVLAGGAASQRSDIYALGVLLYHLVTRGFPVRGANLREIKEAHQRGDVRLLRDARPDLPEAFVRVVERALARDPNERYASAGAFEKALAGVLDATVERPRNRWRRGKRLGVVAAVVGCLAAVVIVWGVHRSRQPKPVRERVLIGAIDNHTGRDQFGFIRHLLSLSLAEQSPQIEILSPDDVQETLVAMGKEKGTRVDRPLEREICLRRNAGTWITGTVDPVAGGFQIAIAVTNPEDGQTRPIEPRTVANEKELLAGAVDDIAARLSAAIGRAGSSASANRRPLELVTTSSLDALKLYTEALDQHAIGKLGPAIDKLKAAVALDRSFALAYSRLAIYEGGAGRLDPAHEDAARAFALSARVSDREQVRIAATHHSYSMQYQLAVEELAKAAELDPRDAESLRNAALLYINMGRPKEGLPKAREAQRRNPRDMVDNGLPALILAIEGKPGEALDEVKQARDRFPSGIYLFWPEGIAHLVRGDTVPAETAFGKMAEASGDDAEYSSYGRYYLAQSLIHRGRLEEAARELEKGVSLDAQAGYQRSELNRKETLASVALLVGDQEEARRHVAHLEGQLRDSPLYLKSLRAAALLEIRLGNVDMARRLLARIEALRKAYPSNLSDGFAAQIRGEITAASGDPGAARNDFDEALRDWPDTKTLESLARYFAGRGDDDRAATYNQEILSQKGWILHEFFIGTWVEAHLELARCERRLGKIAEARAHYTELLALWRDGDRGLPLVAAAERELRELPVR